MIGAQLFLVGGASGMVTEVRDQNCAGGLNCFVHRLCRRRGHLFGAKDNEFNEWVVMIFHNDMNRTQFNLWMIFHVHTYIHMKYF